MNQLIELMKAHPEMTDMEYADAHYQIRYTMRETQQIQYDSDEDDEYESFAKFNTFNEYKSNHTDDEIIEYMLKNKIDSLSNLFGDVLMSSAELLRMIKYANAIAPYSHYYNVKVDDSKLDAIGFVEFHSCTYFDLDRFGVDLYMQRLKARPDFYEICELIRNKEVPYFKSRNRQTFFKMMRDQCKKHFIQMSTSAMLEKTPIPADVIGIIVEF
jgi:hypothetical protein